MIAFLATYPIADGASHMPREGCQVAAKGGRTTEITRGTEKLVYIVVITVIILLQPYSVFSAYSAVRDGVLNWIVSRIWPFGKITRPEQTQGSA
jgi:hypothetical protein